MIGNRLSYSILSDLRGISVFLISIVGSFLLASTNPVVNQSFLMEEAKLNYNQLHAQEFLNLYSGLKEKIQTKSFQILGGIYSKDRWNIYVWDKPLKGADRKTFKYLNTMATGNQSYALDKKNVYFQNKIIAQADPVTFEVLNNHLTRAMNYSYAIDKESVFFRDKRIEKADPKTFQYLDGRVARDGQYFYYKGIRIEDSDVPSYKFIDDKKGFRNRYGKDKHQVYYDFIPLKSSDPASFELLTYGWAKDKNAIYRYQYNYDYFDFDSFSILSDNFIKDHKHVYMMVDYGVQLIRIADSHSFRVLGGGYAKDHNYVYLYNPQTFTIIPEANPQTFSVIDGVYAKDNIQVYIQDGSRYKILKSANIATFNPIGDFYSKDDKHVFYKNSVIPWADVSSFQIVLREQREIKQNLNQLRFEESHAFYDAKDNQYCYFEGEHVACD